MAVLLDSSGQPKTTGAHSGGIARLAGWLLLPVVLAGLAGLWLYRANPLSWLLAAALALVAASSAITIAKPRFRFPCDPVLFVFSAAAVTHLARVRRVRRTLR